MSKLQKIEKLIGHEYIRDDYSETDFLSNDLQASVLDIVQPNVLDIAQPNVLDITKMD